jgi:HAD superfamily hydrolase (TIGR01459 family)
LSEPIPVIDGMRHLAGAYDGLVLDLWGVVHDGERPFPGVTDCMAELRAAGTKLVLLSNAPRRTGLIADRLAELGIAPDSYDGIWSSGEEVWQRLADPDDPQAAALGTRGYQIGAGRDPEAFDGLPQHRVDTPEEAEFVLNTGIENIGDTVETYRAALERCAACNLPMVCANPDLVVQRGAVLEPCAGALAQEYERLGGAVWWLGKPFPEVYERVLAMFGDTPRARIAAIGDSPRTDMTGAQQAGIDGILTACGIHAAEWGMPPDAAKVTADCDALHLRPVAILPSFRW